MMRNANPKQLATLNTLAARAVALKAFDDFPDDALIGYNELSVLTNRSPDTLRKAKQIGKLPIPRHGPQGKYVRFRVGDVRKYLRGELVR